MSDDHILAGVARTVITPPIGSPLTGFLGRGEAVGLHDDLTATALVFDDRLARDETNPTGPIALVACDLLMLSTPEIQRIGDAIHRSVGIPAERVLINCSHTHYGAVTADPRYQMLEAPGIQTRPYLDNLINLVAGIVVAAYRRRQPARLLIGRSDAKIGVNRRLPGPSGEILMEPNPLGEIDHSVEVLRVDEIDGLPLAVAFNHACHAVSLGGAYSEISADFPGVARRLVEQETGAAALFLQGAAGDINPVQIGAGNGDWSEPSRLGLELGNAAIRAFASAQPVKPSIRFASTVLNLPPLVPASESSAELQIAHLEEQERVLLAQGQPNRGALMWLQSQLGGIHAGLQHLRGDALLPSLAAPISAVAFADSAALVTAPAEVFTGIAKKIRQASPFAHTFYSGYTNGYLMYIPTESAYDEGGYEVTHACLVGPGAGSALADESVALLEQLVNPGSVRSRHVRAS